MKIKSLLLGSAAAMIAVSGAQAADAIIVEPEPMEYVKVCDMYGAGFFYIPGTETCMSISGYVRSTYTHSEETSKGNLLDINSGMFLADIDNVVAFNTVSNTSNWTYRGRLNFDVRNETEYGTLRSELRLQGGDAPAGDTAVGIDRALIHLAGFRLGYSDTYWTTNHGYGAGSPAINDGFYDYDQAIFFDYTATLMDGVSVTVGVQDTLGTVFGASSPDLYAGFNATFGGLTVAGTAIRADHIDPFSGKSEDEWAFKGSAIMALGDSGWQVGGWYMKDDGHTLYVTGYTYRDIDEQWGIQVNGAISSNLSVYALYSEATGSVNYAAAGGFIGGPINAELDLDTFSVGTVWAPVSGLTVQVEYSETNYELSSKAPGVVGKNTVDSEGVSVRVTRSF